MEKVNELEPVSVPYMYTLRDDLFKVKFSRRQKSPQIRGRQNNLYQIRLGPHAPLLTLSLPTVGGIPNVNPALTAAQPALEVMLQQLNGSGVTVSSRNQEVPGSNPAMPPILRPWERHFTRISSLHSGDNEFYGAVTTPCD
ncbi:hypothetical protein Bbelb_336160 [Branchiostoma belcheri]|nr:hypothetical protein Bbelb_336160 [Branchiostoma belcheri]